MDDLRAELMAAEREMQAIRTGKDKLMNQLDSHLFNASPAGVPSIFEDSLDEKNGIRSTTVTTETNCGNSTPSESNLLQHIWKIKRVTRDDYVTSVTSSTPNSTAAKVTKHTKSMQTLPILMNPMFHHRALNETPVLQRNPISSILATNLNHPNAGDTSSTSGASFSDLPLRKAISLELPSKMRSSNDDSSTYASDVSITV